MRCCISTALVGVLAMLAACSKPPTPTAPKSVRMYLTCDVSGRIEPCGCFTGQLGGLTRLKSVLDADHALSLRVDAGDALAGAEDFQVIQYRHVLKAFESLGYHAVNVGRREAALAADTLSEVAKGSSVPVLSANLLDAKTNQPLLRPWVATEIGGVRYGIIGVVDPASIAEGQLGEGLIASDPASAIGALLPEVRRVSDVVVLLAFATEERMRALADQFFELHVILGGDVRQPSQDLVRANRSLLLATTNQGRAIGLLESKLVDGQLMKPKQSILMLDMQIPQHAGIAALAAGYREEVRRATLSIDEPERATANSVPGVRATATFVGTAACAPCHAEANAIWQKTGHARAWAALVKRESDADPSCIGCHSVGFGSASGYRRAFKGSQFVEVGCESCHGPGSKHVAERLSGQPVTFTFRPLGAGDCVECHHGEFSRPFEYAEFWKFIEHGKRTPAK